MTDDSERFRKRAKDCRGLAQNARDPHDRKVLKEMAIELEQEADKMDAEAKRD